MKKFKKLSLFLILAAFMVIAAACGGAEEEPTENAEGTEDKKQETAELEGSVVIDGSGTVYPFMAKMAENYMTNEQENVSVEVGRAGTSAGFKKFLVEADGTDFNDASRQIKDEEKAKADELGIEVQELKVALDGLTFVINPDNDWAKELTADQVKEIFLKLKVTVKTGQTLILHSQMNQSKQWDLTKTMEHMNSSGKKFLKKQDLVEGINLQQEYSTFS